MAMVKALVKRLLHRGERELASGGPEWTTVVGGPLAGHQLLLHIGAAPWQAEMRDGEFDKFIYEAQPILERLDGGVAWDIGAHVGYHTLCFAALAGENGSVVAFEPNPVNLERLRANAGRNPDLAGRVQIVDRALSDCNGESPFVFSPVVDDGSSSGCGLEEAFRLNRDIDTTGVTRINVRMLRADDLVRDGFVPPPDVVKMDVEGGEHFVLLGAAEVIAKHRPVFVIEVHNVTAMFHTQRILIEAGYRTCIMDDEHSTSARCHMIGVPRPNDSL